MVKEIVIIKMLKANSVKEKGEVSVYCVNYNRKMTAAENLLILSIINAKLETKYAK